MCLNLQYYIIFVFKYNLLVILRISVVINNFKKIILQTKLLMRNPPGSKMLDQFSYNNYYLQQFYHGSHPWSYFTV